MKMKWIVSIAALMGLPLFAVGGCNKNGPETQCPAVSDHLVQLTPEQERQLEQRREATVTVVNELFEGIDDEKVRRIRGILEEQYTINFTPDDSGSIRLDPSERLPLLDDQVGPSVISNFYRCLRIACDQIDGVWKETGVLVPGCYTKETDGVVASLSKGFMYALLSQECWWKHLGKGLTGILQ